MNKAIIESMKERLLERKLHPSCKKACHRYCDSCTLHAVNVFVNCIIGSSKIYFPLYLMGAVLSRKILKGPRYFFLTLIPDVLQSSLFIAVIASVWYRLMCLFYQASGRHLKTSLLLAPIIAGWLGFLVEKKSRRRELAVYLAQQGLESICRMIVSRKYVPYSDFLSSNVEYFKTLLFAMSTSVLLYLQKNEPHLLAPSCSKMLALLFPFEKRPDGIEERITKVVLRIKNSIFGPLIKDRLSDQEKRQEEHKAAICNHRKQGLGCVAYCAVGFMRSFAIGLSIRIFFFLLPRLLNPKKLQWKKMMPFFKRESLHLALFFGCSTGIARSVQCILRKLRGKEDGMNQIVAGFLAGFSFHFNGYTELCMYVLSKAAESIWQVAENRGLAKPFPYAESTIFSLGIGLLFYNGLTAPHDVRLSYLRFLSRCSNYLFSHGFLWFTKVREEVLTGGVAHNPEAYERVFKIIKRTAENNPWRDPPIVF